jgi:alpha-beta hydrolase superfamily lysophospholipase
MLTDSAHEILRETDKVRLGAFARIDEFLDEHASR